jgi:hypothetical protein
MLVSCNFYLTNRDLCYLLDAVPLFWRYFQLCVFTENAKIKVEWTVLIAPIRKSRCGAPAISNVHCVVLLLERRRLTVGLVRL